MLELEVTRGPASTLKLHEFGFAKIGISLMTRSRVVLQFSIWNSAETYVPVYPKGASPSSQKPEKGNCAMPVGSCRSMFSDKQNVGPMRSPLMFVTTEL
jgi:hypothetical protein